MKLRGGVWVSDSSDAEALATLNASVLAPIKVVEQSARLLRFARKDEEISCAAEFESHPMELTARFIKAVMQ